VTGGGGAGVTKEEIHTQHRIKEKYVSGCNVFRKLQSAKRSAVREEPHVVYNVHLRIEELRESGLLILVAKL
jgi:hypothetical protein